MAVSAKMFERIQKFGLKHHDLSTMLWNIAFMLRLVTLNLDDRNKNRIPIFFYLLTLTSLACYVYVFMVSTCWFIFFRNKGEELLEKIIIFTLGITSMSGVTKFAYTYWKRKALQKMVAAYLLCDSHVMPYSRMSRSIKTTLRTVKKRAMVFWATIAGNAIIYVLIPFFTPGRRLPDDKQIIWGLEPMLQSPNFEIAYTVIVLCLHIVFFGVVNITVFLIVVVGYTEAQITALSQELLNLWADAQMDYKQRALKMNHFARVNSRRVLVNQYVKHRLGTIIKSHAFNKQLINQVKDVFRNALALELILLSISIIATLLGGLENTYMSIPFVLIQVAMECFIGQKLLDANTAFEIAVYDCKWENFDVSNMKLVMVMLLNAQQPMKLSARGVSSLSYMLLMSVLRLIYQAYTALRSTMN